MILLPVSAQSTLTVWRVLPGSGVNSKSLNLPSFAIMAAKARCVPIHLQGDLDDNSWVTYVGTPHENDCNEGSQYNRTSRLKH